METWKILVISLSAALAVGLIFGTTIGKIMVKRAKSPHKPLLTIKERVIYSACVVLGTVLVLFGVFFNFGGAQTAEMQPDGTQIAEQNIAGGNVKINSPKVVRSSKPRSATMVAKAG